MSKHLEESPSEKMDISSDQTQDSPVSEDLDEISRPNLENLNTASSSSTTLSNNQMNQDDSSAELDKIVSTITKNMNSLSTTSTTSNLTDKTKETNDNETLDNHHRSKDQKKEQQQHHKLTSVTVNSHPLMMLNDSDSEDSYNNTNRKVNYPDVVPEIEQKQHQPLRLANPVTQKIQNSKRSSGINSTTTTSSKKSTVDVVNSVNNNSSSKKYKKPMYREPSPDLNDFLSSDSDPEFSQYQTELHPSFQTVALVSNPPRLQQSTSSPKSLNLSGRRKVPLTDDLKGDNDDCVSSNDDSLSNHSFNFHDDDDDLDDEFNLDLPPNRQQQKIMSPSDSDNKAASTNGNFQNNPNNCKPILYQSVVERIPEYSAAEENRNVRNFQLITLPDGKTREIDMKVIEPYKRILSHGGYLKSGGHNAIIVFSACHLPDRSRADYNYVMNNLFYYVIKTLEQLVTEDYVLVYLHGASNRKNSPPFPWLKKCYQLLDRRLRKSLKSCYIVHPTFWLKSLVWMTRPFISSKFWRKLVYVRSLEELYTLVPVEKNSIPDKVKNYNSRHS